MQSANPDPFVLLSKQLGSGSSDERQFWLRLRRSDWGSIGFGGSRVAADSSHRISNYGDYDRTVGRAKWGVQSGGCGCRGSGSGVDSDIANKQTPLQKKMK